MALRRRRRRGGIELLAQLGSRFWGKRIWPRHRRCSTRRSIGERPRASSDLRTLLLGPMLGLAVAAAPPIAPRTFESQHHVCMHSHVYRCYLLEAVPVAGFIAMTTDSIIFYPLCAPRITRITRVRFLDILGAERGGRKMSCGRSGRGRTRKQIDGKVEKVNGHPSIRPHHHSSHHPAHTGDPLQDIHH